MRDPQKSGSPLGELREFIDFLKSLWAILASTSVFFPLSNQFVQVIPIANWPEGGLMHFAPSVVTTIATLAALFITLWVFAKREYFSRGRVWRLLPKRAAMSFVVGFIALLIYLCIEYLISHDFYFRVLDWESGDLRAIAGDLCLLIAYVSCFTLITHAFLLLGMREFLRNRIKKA